MEHITPFLSDLVEAIANGYTEDFQFLSNGILVNVKNQEQVTCRYCVDQVISQEFTRSNLYCISTDNGIRGTAFTYWDEA